MGAIRSWRWAVAVCLFLTLLSTVSCGDDDDDGGAASSTPSATAEFPVTIDAANGPVTIQERPEAIVSLSPTATEMLFAIDADDQVIAVDDQSNYPPEAPTTDLSGFEPNVEAIASYEPDLVVVSNETGDVSKSLERLDIPVLLQPAAGTLDDTYAQIEDLGEATGHTDEAAALIDSMLTEIQEIVSDVPVFDTAPTYYHELDNQYFSVTSDTFIGQVYALLGLANIADEAKGAASGYPQLSAEYIVDADPDIIFLADTKCCKESAATVAERPGWDQISAVANGNVVELDDDIASRWGPRVVDYLQVVVGALEELDSGT